MSKLSSESLFHYVTERKYLVDILERNFRPRYVKENFIFESGSQSQVALPMLCFCDIKLSNIEEHVQWYGKYGIGMKKEWAISKGLTPVHYYNPESHVIVELSDAINEMRINININQSSNSSFISNYYNLWFMKPFEGEQYNQSEEKYKRKKFYDEREWRYIPSLKQLKLLAPELPMSIKGLKLKEFIEDDKYKKELNMKIGSKINLDFTPHDIAYIIVANEAERKEIIKEIKRAKSRFDKETIEIVFSKIISLEQINNDF